MEQALEYTPNKTETVRFLGTFDVAALKQKVLDLDEDFWDKEEDFQANYNKKLSLRYTKHIVFRFANKREKPYQYFALPAWDEWREALLPIMEEIVKEYGYDNGFYPRVMLAKLPPGGMIKPHVDGIPPKVGGHKIHLALKTNPDCFFYIIPERFHFKEGEAYEVNNAAMHSVINNGDTDRIHLIFEYLNVDLQTNRDHFPQV